MAAASGEQSVDKRKRKRKRKREEAADDGELVEINVGGRIFTTTWTTLMQSAYFRSMREKMLDGRMQPALRDKRGRIFIDSNPASFSVMLDYVRTQKAPKKFSDSDSAIFDFFGIDMPHEFRHSGVRLLPDYDLILEYFGERVRAGAFARGYYDNRVEYPNSMDFNIPREWIDFARTKTGRIALNSALREDLDVRGVIFCETNRISAVSDIQLKLTTCATGRTVWRLIAEVSSR